MINQEALAHNQRVKHGTGDCKFLVKHSGGMITPYWANNRNHLKRLIRIDLNMGYILSVDEIKNETDGIQLSLF